MPDEIQIATEDLRALFDLAVNSLNFGSGFWGRDDTEVARRVAALLGVDPLVATPRDAARHYPHPFKASGTAQYQLDCCEHCLRPQEEHRWPDAVEEKPDA